MNIYILILLVVVGLPWLILGIAHLYFAIDDYFYSKREKIEMQELITKMDQNNKLIDEALEKGDYDQVDRLMNRIKYL